MPRNIYGPDHESFRESVREFVERSLKPRAEEMLALKVIPRDIWVTAGKQGLLGLDIPEQYGGAGADDYLFNAISAEEIAKFNAAASSCFGIHSDVCHALELAMEKGRGGQAYFVSDGADSTLKQVISGLLQTRAIEPPSASAPLPVAWAMASLMEWIWRTFSRHGEPPLTRQMLRLIGKPFTLDISKAQRELGYQPVISWAQGIQAMYVATQDSTQRMKR